MFGYYMNSKLDVNGFIAIFRNLVAFFQTCKTSQIIGNSLINQSSPGVIFEEKNRPNFYPRNFGMSQKCQKRIQNIGEI